MPSHFANMKSKAANTHSSARLAPSGSPGGKTPRTPNRPPQHQANLSLHTVVGTTTTSPNGFSSHDQSRSFAVCAGSAAVLAEVGADNTVSQRFFRARPSATSVNPVTSFYNQSTPPGTPDPRSRSVSGIKSTPHGNGLTGSPASYELPDGGSPRPWSSRERVKAVTSVCISPNGRLLAVGETGYNPRVMIFSTDKDAAGDIPLSILHEHTFGVRSLAFSSNSLYLASLGDANDGFLFVWSVNLKNGSAKLHSTNKCTTHVRDMHWMGQTLITVGVRHVKVWRLPDTRPGSPTKSRLTLDGTPSSPSIAPKALTGRNCVLGPLVDSTFTSVVSVSEHEAVVGTESGTLCFLDDAEGSQKLSVVQNLDFGVTSLAFDVDESSLWVGGRGNRIRRFSMETLRTPVTPSRPTSSRSSNGGKAMEPAIACLGSLSSHIIAIDSTKAIHLCPTDALDQSDELTHMEKTLLGHTDSVLGVGPLKTPNPTGADFFTWSRGGMVNFLDTRGYCHSSRTIALDHLPDMDDESCNELRVLRSTEDMDFFLSGDRLGVLRIFAGESWDCVHEVRAHGGEITDIALHEDDDTCLVASSGRDRMVQLFQKTEEGLELVQTMDDHVGSVGQLLFIDDGNKLLSCSADRTILIREQATRDVDGGTAIAYLTMRAITMKSSPVSMTLSAEDSDRLIVSTADRCIQQYDLNSGRHVQSFRAADSESGDTVVMGSLASAAEVDGESPPLLFGVSGTDKSIRIYDLERCALLAGEFGHTEGISGVHLLEKRSGDPDGPVTRTLISTGMDGVVMIWDISVQPNQSQDFTQSTSNEEDGPSKDLASSKPLRKILSRNEIAEFQRPEHLGTPTPTRAHSPPLIRKVSKLSLSSARYGHPTTPSVSVRRPSTSGTRPDHARRTPSPPSPQSTVASRHRSGHHSRRSSLDSRHHAPKSTKSKSKFGSINMSTEQVCHTLQAYRRKLDRCKDRIRTQKTLERELQLTLQVLDARAQHEEDGELESDSSSKENESTPGDIKHKHVRRPRRASSSSELSDTESDKTQHLSVDSDGEG